MGISEACIRRPVMTTLITAALIVFGIFGYRLLSVAALPAVDYPQPGGLGWDQLARVVETAVTGRPVGWDITIYNPDLDPARVHARRIVEFLGRLIGRVADAATSPQPEGFLWNQYTPYTALTVQLRGADTGSSGGASSGLLIIVGILGAIIVVVGIVMIARRGKSDEDLA